MTTPKLDSQTTKQAMAEIGRAMQQYADRYRAAMTEVGRALREMDRTLTERASWPPRHVGDRRG